MFRRRDNVLSLDDALAYKVKSEDGARACIIFLERELRENITQCSKRPAELDKLGELFENALDG